MFDKPALTATAARDPLATVFALFVLGGLATYFLFKTRPIGRAIASIVFPTFLTIAFLRADIVHYQPMRSTGTPSRDVVHGVLEVAWWLWGLDFWSASCLPLLSFNAAHARTSCFRTSSSA
jgi:hypothetical protein